MVAPNIKILSKLDVLHIVCKVSVTLFPEYIGSENKFFFLEFPCAKIRIQAI